MATSSKAEVRKRLRNPVPVADVAAVPETTSASYLKRFTTRLTRAAEIVLSHARSSLLGSFLGCSFADNERAANRRLAGEGFQGLDFFCQSGASL